MFILRKSSAAILFGIIAVLFATIPSAVATAEELLPCPDKDHGQTIMWDRDHYIECTDGMWFVRACAPGTTIHEDISGSAFCR